MRPLAEAGRRQTFNPSSMDRMHPACPALASTYQLVAMPYSVGHSRLQVTGRRRAASPAQHRIAGSLWPPVRRWRRDGRYLDNQGLSRQHPPTRSPAKQASAGVEPVASMRLWCLTARVARESSVAEQKDMGLQKTGRATAARGDTVCYSHRHGRFGACFWRTLAIGPRWFCPCPPP